MTSPFSSSHGFPEPPELGLPAHRRALRRALLAAHEKRTSRSPLGLLSLFSMKRFAPLAVFGIALAVVAATSFIPQASITTPVANAQELVNRATTKLPTISTEIRAEIEKRMKADMEQTLAEAKAAPDLRILTPEEYAQEMQAQMKADMEAAKEHSAEGGQVMHFSSAAPIGMGIAVGSEGSVSANAETKEVRIIKIDRDQMQPAEDVMFEAAVPGEKFEISPVHIKEPVKYLAYTSPSGQSVVLGLDEDDVPVMKMVRMTVTFGDGSDGNVMMGTINWVGAEETKTE